jgi:tetraacyldisaccharide 4'-kinase
VKPPLEHPLTTTLLRPIAGVYGRLVALRNRRYDDLRRVHHVAAPVLSVGNLTVGGTGKTPLVAWLASRLRAGGRWPAVVSRGYGGRAGRGPLVVSTGEGPRVPSGVSGDEPWLLAATLPGVRVVVGSDRRRGAEEALRLGADTVILDDGFQHRRLGRDLDIVLLDAGDPFGGDALMPAGRLREAPSGLGRADVILVTRDPTPQRLEEVTRIAREHNTDAPVLAAGHLRVGFFDSAGRAVPRPERVVAFCGIGNPGLFRADLEAEGSEIIRLDAYRDHHVYTDAELRGLRREAAAVNAALVTTEKDLARLGDRSRAAPGPEISVLRVAAVVYDSDRLDRAVSSALNDGSRRVSSARTETD